MGLRSGETRTESCELIAKEDVAAIAFSWKLTLKGWLPRLGRVTRIVEGLVRCGAAPIIGVCPYGAGLPGALLIEPTALGEYAGLEFTGGDVFRTFGSIKPLCSELASR